MPLYIPAPAGAGDARLAPSRSVSCLSLPSSLSPALCLLLYRCAPPCAHKQHARTHTVTVAASDSRLAPLTDYYRRYLSTRQGASDCGCRRLSRGSPSSTRGCRRATHSHRTAPVSPRATTTTSPHCCCIPSPRHASVRRCTVVSPTRTPLVALTTRWPRAGLVLTSC